MALTFFNEGHSMAAPFCLGHNLSKNHLPTTREAWFPNPLMGNEARPSGMCTFSLTTN